MSHYQSKGDRSEAQLKKAGRSSGPGHQRSGAPSTAVKGGGAGGPSPSGSAPPASGASLTNSQSFSATSSGRPTTPGSSTNRGGKRANGPAGVGRNAQSGGFTDHGGNYRNPHHTGAQHQSHQPQQQQPAPGIRQGVGPADANQHTPTSAIQQPELKQATPAVQASNSFGRASGTGGASAPSARQPPNPVISGAAAKPPAPVPVVPAASADVPEPSSPVTTVASSGDNVRASTQPSFSFQFGSISPVQFGTIMNPVPGMQIPARTSSAPPNLDEQKREQARFEASRAVVPKKAPTVPSGQQQVQVTGAVGNASEQQQPVVHANQNANSQSSVTVAGTPVVQPPLASQPQGLAPQPVQFSQGQVHVSQHSQAPVHIPATAQVPSQHFQQHLQLAQAQAQAQAQQLQQAHAQQQQQPQQQQQVHAQQPLPQQSLPVPQSLSQGMKYPQSMMAPHGPQIISQQMGSPLTGQVSPQMAHQLGPSMGGQLPPGISGAQYGSPTPNQFIQPQPSRAVKIVNPDTLEELRFDKTNKGEHYMDAGAPTSVAASSVRVSSNGPQSRSVNYGSGPHHIPYYQQPYPPHAPQGFYQPVPPKSVSAPSGPVNPPLSRPYSYGPPQPTFGRHMTIPGAVSNPPASKGVPSGGPSGQAGVDISNSGSAAVAVSSPASGPPHPISQAIPPALSGRPAAIRPPSPMLQPGGGQFPASNGRVSSGSMPSSAATSPSVALTPATPPTSSGVVLKFGDVEASGSAGSVSSGESPAESVTAPQVPSSGANGATSVADQGVLHHIVSSTGSEGLSARRDQVSKTSAATATTPKPSISVPSSKVTSTSLAATTTSPRVSAVPSIAPPVTGDKPKSDSVKPAIVRENSRKPKKEQKQQKQQQQQQQPPSPTVVVSGDSEGDRKGEALTPSSSSVAGTSQTPTSVGSGVSPKPSHPVVQGSNSGAPSKATNSIGKSEDSKGTSKAVDLEKRASGKFSVLSPQSSEVADISLLVHLQKPATVLASEGEEVFVRKPSKQISGKLLSTSKSFEVKDNLTIDSSSSKAGVSTKVNSSWKAPFSVASTKEPIIGPSVGVSAKGVPAVKVSPTATVLSNSSEAGDDGLEKPIAAEQVNSDSGSAARTELEVDNSATETGIIPPSPSPVSGISAVEENFSKVERGVLPPVEALKEVNLDEFSDLESVASKDADVALNPLANGRVPIEEQVVLDAPVDDGLSTFKGTAASTNDSTAHPEIPSVEKEVGEQKEPVSETGGISDQTGVEPMASNAPLPHPTVSGIEKELGTEDISLSKVVAEELEISVGDTAVVGRESGASIGMEGALDKSVSDLDGKSLEIPLGSETEVKENAGSLVESLAESGDHPSANEVSIEETVLSSVDKIPNGVSDDGVSSVSLSAAASEVQSPDYAGAVEEDNPKEAPENISSAAGSNPHFEIDNSSASVPEVKQVGSKKKKKKEIFAKADAQGSTGDLFTAYKSPEEKKLDEVKRPETPGSANPSGTDAKKDPLSSSEKPIFKELDDWEDAAELPTPKIIPTPSSAPAPNLSSVPGEVVDGISDFGVRKYTRDYLLSQRDLHRDVPFEFEIRADIADILLNPQLSAGFTDSLPSPGRSLDRQLSGPRLDRRNSNLGSAEEDRWTRNAPVSSPGRGPSESRMDMGMPGPPGGFRPGQGNTGIMRMPPGMRPGMGPPGIMSPGMGGLLPGGPLLPMMMPAGAGGPGRNVGGVDADRWQRAPVGQKGLIPSPRTPLPAIHKTENRYQVGTISDEEQLKQRLIKGILNKLTPQNFDKLFAQVKEVNIDSATTLTGVISQIFDKALTEPTFCEMYAKFCVQLAVELPEFVEDEEKITFKRVLLNKCQEEFERGEREQEEAEKLEEDGEVKLTKEEREEKRTSARRRMLGNIRFIGELYKKNMLTERIMHECIKKLLGEYQNPDEEDVEALCKLMSTIGRIIDHPKAKEHIDAYFKRMEMLSENLKLSSRLRFMLKDVIDLRRNGWTERRKVEGPKKIDEVHRDAVQERQQAAASSRDRPQQRGGLGPGGGRRPGGDFGMRGPPSPMYSSGQMGGGMGMGGMRGAQPPPGPGVRGGFGQDVRMEDRLMMPDSRPMPMPISQRPSDEGSLTLGPQGSLGRAAMRQPIVAGRSALADVPSMMMSDVRRPGMGPMGPGFGGLMSDRGPYGGREDLSMRSHGAERPHGSSDRPGPLLERPLGPDRLDRMGPGLSVRDMRGPERPLSRDGPHSRDVSERPLSRDGHERPLSRDGHERPLSRDGHERPLSRDGHERSLSRDGLERSLSRDGLERPRSREGPMERPGFSLGPSSSSLRPLTPPTPVPARTTPAAPLQLSEEDLKKKSISAITEYFSVRDIKEAAECVEDLKTPRYHPKMVSLWVLASFDKKDADRDALVKLLIYICKERDPPLLSHDQSSKGFELVLSTWEETIMDAPKAPDYVGEMLAKLVTAGVFSLAHVGKLSKEGGTEPGSMLEFGDALNLIGVVLDAIRREKGEAAMVHLYKESKLNLEQFLSPDDKKKAGKFEVFLERKNLQSLYPMIPLEKYLREAIARDEPAVEILKWVEVNVAESISSEPAFFRFVMTEVLRNSVPLDASGHLVPKFDDVLEGNIKKFSLLLKRLLKRNVRASEANQRHYIVAVQLFANELGHPHGLVSALFTKFYAEDVISDMAFLKWKDDVKDSTPGRDKAIKETFNFFWELESAPEEGGDDDE